MQKVSIKVQQPNGMELIHTAEEVLWNENTKKMEIRSGNTWKSIHLTYGMKAFVMNERASTIAIYKG